MKGNEASLSDIVVVVFVGCNECKLTFNDHLLSFYHHRLESLDVRQASCDDRSLALITPRRSFLAAS